ncbi:hypothetical protein KCP76_12820 [Salmonella enterica subsp. enterica serovar Weltevreden]|nr:hypothetical protein KCP76_12820 [Salmonella enterica subsp. enterica serovar Weltevreden]
MNSGIRACLMRRSKPSPARRAVVPLPDITSVCCIYPPRSAAYGVLLNLTTVTIQSSSPQNTAENGVIHDEYLTGTTVLRATLCLKNTIIPVLLPMGCQRTVRKADPRKKCLVTCSSFSEYPSQVGALDAGCAGCCRALMEYLRQI